ncbi:MAG: helix-turn-helix domain-containing protein [Niallia sp.]
MIYLAQYRTHQTIAGLDLSVKEHLYHNYDKLTKSDKQVLTCLAQHSLKHVGACHLKTFTIAEEIDKSDSTVKRSIKRLSEIGIIEIVNTSKMNGIKGANIYRINFFNQDVTHRIEPSKMNHRPTQETPRSSKAQDTENETVSLKSFNLSSNFFVNKNVVNNVNACTESDLKLQLRTIYNPQSMEGNQAFEELCKIAFGRLKQYMQSHQVPYTQMEQIVLKAMHDLVRKQGVRNQFAMYSKMIERQTLQLFEQHIQPKRPVNNFGKKVGVVPDWFTNREHEQKEEAPISAEQQRYFEEKRKELLAKLG